MNVRKLFLVSVGVVAGFAGGVVVTGRMAGTQPSAAQPAAPRVTMSAPAPQAPAMPDLSDVAERAIKASVNISSTQWFQTNTWYRAMGGDDVVPQTSLGSGVIVSADGYVLTNSHVAQNANADIKVTLPDNRALPAKVVGIDVPSDLALLKVAATGLTPLPWADSDKLRVAEWVLAVGNPEEFSQTVTQGIVSTVLRHDARLAVYNDFIQTDAAINPGNSGGPLVNSRGELVGINTMIYSQTGVYSGIGFAIPSNLAKDIMSELKANGSIRRGSIGLDSNYLVTITKDLAQRYSLPVDHGVGVRNLSRGSAALTAGLQPGDIIMGFNGEPIDAADQLQRLIAKAPIGSQATLEINRNGKTTMIKIPVTQMTTRGR